jgi:hypothetical protein
MRSALLILVFAVVYVARAQLPRTWGPACFYATKLSTCAHLNDEQLYLSFENIAADTAALNLSANFHRRRMIDERGAVQTIAPETPQQTVAVALDAAIGAAIAAGTASRTVTAQCAVAATYFLCNRHLQRCRPSTPLNGVGAMGTECASSLAAYQQRCATSALQWPLTYSLAEYTARCMCQLTYTTSGAGMCRPPSSPSSLK